MVSKGTLHWTTYSKTVVLDHVLSEVRSIEYWLIIPHCWLIIHSGKTRQDNEYR